MERPSRLLPLYPDFGQHQGMQDTFKADRQGNCHQKTGRRPSQKRRQAPGQPDGQHRKRCHHKASGKIMAADPNRVKTPDAGGGDEKDDCYEYATIVQPGKGEQSEQSKEVAGRGVENAPSGV